MMKKLFGYILVAAVFMLIGMQLAETKIADQAGSAVRNMKNKAIEVVGNTADLSTRTMVLAENPELIPRILESGSFGGDASLAAAQNIFGRAEEAIEDVMDKTRVIEVGPRSYLIRMPIVNAVFLETDAGIVLVDTGMGPAGPAILKAMNWREATYPPSSNMHINK